MCYKYVTQCCDLSSLLLQRIDRNEPVAFYLFLFALEIRTNSASFLGNSKSIFSFLRLEEEEEEVEEKKICPRSRLGEEKLNFDFDDGSSRTCQISRQNGLIELHNPLV